MFKITIIIPVYNTPIDILKRCFDSLLNQTSKYFKVIIVINGKNENESFIRNYFTNNKNILFISLDKNIGYCGARQMAIDASSTEYIAFLDADDEIANKYVELFYKNISIYKYDLIFIRHNVIKNGELVIRNNSKKNYSFKKNKLKLSIIDPAGWKKIINKKFILDNDISFIYDVNNIIEDLYFHMCLVFKFKSAFYIGEIPMYNYYFNKGSTINNLIDDGKITDIVMNNVYTFYEKYKSEKHITFFIFKYLLISKNWPRLIFRTLNKIAVNKFMSFILTLIYIPLLVIYYASTKLINYRNKFMKT